jgi:flagellar hook-basal body complex protein FliE
MNQFIVPITPLNLNTEIKPNLNVNEVENSGFQDIFKDMINQTQEAQAISNQDSYNLAMGNTDDLHNVMINAEKAAIALELTVQVTSKAISAYNEIMRMQF